MKRRKNKNKFTNEKLTQFTFAPVEVYIIGDNISFTFVNRSVADKFVQELEEIANGGVTNPDELVKYEEGADYTVLPVKVYISSDAAIQSAVLME